MPIRTLESPPAERHTHLWADYVEMLCLANTDGLIARAEVVDRWRSSKDTDDEDEEEADDRLEAGAGTSVEGGEMAAPAADSRAKYSYDVFKQFSFRASTFGEAYPFELTSQGVLQSLPVTTPGQQLYLFLLLCSSLRYIRKVEWGRLTKGFERISADAIRAWLPPGAQVHIFGTNSQDGERYTGTLQDKLILLAADLSEVLLLKEEHFRRGDTGDAGCDVVAWVPFSDTAGAMLVFLAQATCKVKWVAKQQESSTATWRGILTWKAPHNNVLCIPFCFRSPNGSWYWERDIKESIILDRVRLLALLGTGVSLPSPQLDVVARALEYKEPLF